MIPIDAAWDHQDLQRAYTVYARSLLQKRPPSTVEPLLEALKSYGRAVRASLEAIRAGSRSDEEALQRGYDAVVAMGADVIGEPYVVYLGAHARPGKSAFCALVRRGGREQQFLRVFEQHTLEGVTDAGVDFAHNLLSSKDAAVGVYVITPTSRQNVLAMPWTEEGHRFFRRVSREAYRAVYDRDPA